MVTIHIPADRWRCDQRTSLCPTSKLAGQIVVADRKPFLIDRVTELPTDKWPDKFVQAWHEDGMPDVDTWPSRPMLVTGFWEGPNADSRAHGAAAPASHLWDVLPDHYSVCRKCFELPPCRHVHNERVMAQASEQMAEEMAILPGSCHGCREPITRRQKSFTFPGPNLIRPDFGNDTAIFHTRGACRSALDSYDKRWADAEEGRSRFFFCGGTQTIHHDGSTECDSAECVANGDHRDLVDHQCRIWHHPGDRPHCWCLVSLD